MAPISNMDRYLTMVLARRATRLIQDGRLDEDEALRELQQRMVALKQLPVAELTAQVLRDLPDWAFGHS